MYVCMYVYTCVCVCKINKKRWKNYFLASGFLFLCSWVSVYKYVSARMYDFVDAKCAQPVMNRNRFEADQILDSFA